MAAITLTTNSATISTSEYFLASNSTTATYQTSDVILQAEIDLAAMTATETYQITIYEKVDGTNVKTIYGPVILIGAQARAFVAPAFIVGNGWEVGVKKIAGTDRAIPWTLAKVG